ncbi:MAG TPA: CoA-binding protein [Candidatus Nanoarchaeia archaeon]|nr:CoA-binding protein [Candidatus Nanoarchaeia archaeon]
MALNDLFNPKSVAVIGASRDTKSAGYGILKNLVEGSFLKCRYGKPFGGKVYAINPNADEILGKNCFPSIARISEPIDLAIIALPVKIVEKEVDNCIKKKVKSIILISTGFAEIGKEGKAIQDRIAGKLKKRKIDLLGPNCLGIIRTSTHLNATFAPSMPPPGKIAFISQSGALANSVIDWAIEERYGFSSIVSIGNQADKDIPDFIEYFARDEETKVITLYIEGLKDGKKFLNIAKKAKKPIIAIKSGKTAHGKSAVSSHTGSLAGDYEVYQAAFKQAGVILAESVEEMFDIAKALASQPIPTKNAIAIVTNGGGPGVLCADYCSENGVNLITLEKNTIKELESSNLMHPAFSRSNPLDIVGDALPERYKFAINTLLSKDYIAGLIIIQTLQTMTDSAENARAIVEASKKYPDKPIICTYIGGKFSRQSIIYLEANSVPDYNDVRKSAKVMAALVGRIKR